MLGLHVGSKYKYLINFTYFTDPFGMKNLNSNAKSKHKC